MTVIFEEGNRESAEVALAFLIKLGLYQNHQFAMQQLQELRLKRQKARQLQLSDLKILKRKEATKNEKKRKGTKSGRVNPRV